MQLETKLKIVLRRLPPNLPQSVLLQSIDEFMADGSITYAEFQRGKLYKSLAKLNRDSVAFLSFRNSDDLLKFNQKFKNHLFVDGKGKESRVDIELAPFQKIPEPVKRVDKRVNTIGADSDYIAFLESLEKDVDTPTDLAPVVIANKSSALLDELRAQKNAARTKARLESEKRKKAVIPTYSNASGSKATVEAAAKNNSFVNATHNLSQPAKKPRKKKKAAIPANVKKVNVAASAPLHAVVQSGNSKSLASHTTIQSSLLENSKPSQSSFKVSLKKHDGSSQNFDSKGRNGKNSV